jgi:hypothetical protein
MSSYKYLIIGGDMTADSAMNGSSCHTAICPVAVH